MGVLGQTRDRTNLYFEFRFQKQGAKGAGVEKQNLVGGHDVEEGKSGLTVAPPWVQLSDDIALDIERIKEQMKRLVEIHSKLLLPQFDESIEDEQTIEILTSEITKMFQVARGKAMKLQKIQVDEQEAPMRKNMASMAASNLQDLSLVFRKAQKDYLHSTVDPFCDNSGLKSRQQRGKAAFSIEEDVLEDDTKFEVAQSEKVVASEEMITQREKEIKEIAKSINELASIFKDLSVMVIEQGTILDRIDYNIEQVEHNTTVAVKQLDEAKKIQGSYRNKLCMLLLCIGVFAMILVVMVKGFAFK